MISYGILNRKRMQANVPAAVLAGPNTGTSPLSAEVGYVLW